MISNPKLEFPFDPSRAPLTRLASTYVARIHEKRSFVLPTKFLEYPI
jgi:hypothetical protein